MEYKIRAAEMNDLNAVFRLEEICFSKKEAAGEEALRGRLQLFKDSFFVAEDSEGALIGFIDGNVTDSRVIQDEMFADETLHNPQGAYQSVFGLGVAPSLRNHGVASCLMKHLIKAARDKGRKGLILTCKEHLISYYERFGYRSFGISASVHGGAVWYDMILEF